MSGGFDRDFGWQMQYANAVRQKVGPLLLVPASWERDTKEATDFMLFRVIGQDVNAVAARVRRAEILKDSRWPHWQWQFTVRLWRRSGAKTEHDKLVEGYADWFFYGVADPSGAPEFAHWMLVNLRAWRSALAKPEARRSLLVEDKNNTDNTTGFRAYDILSFPQDPSILIAASFTWPPRKVEKTPDLFDWQPLPVLPWEDGE